MGGEPIVRKNGIRGFGGGTILYDQNINPLRSDFIHHVVKLGQGLLVNYFRMALMGLKKIIDGCFGIEAKSAGPNHQEVLGGLHRTKPCSAG